MYLLRRGDQAYVLGIEQITQYLVGKEAFDQQLDEKALQGRQQEFLLGKIRSSAKKNRKSRELKAKAYEGKISDRKQVAKFLKSAAEPEETSFQRLGSPPKLQSKRKASPKKKKKKPKAKKPNNKRAAARNQQKPSEEQVERERQRRAEMEKEALESGGVAFEAEPEEDDSESCDDTEYMEEENADVIDLSDVGEDDDAEDINADENGEDELDLDDF